MTKADRRERAILLRAAATERRYVTMTGVAFTWWLEIPAITSGEDTAQIIESAAYAWSDGP